MGDGCSPSPNTCCLFVEVGLETLETLKNLETIFVLFWWDETLTIYLKAFKMYI
jgi:hypothetical protein